MFKKLKDKLTEEVKIPSQKFTQSMQQLAQAVVSPVSSNSATFDSASNDNFSIDGEFDDTPQGTPVKKGPPEGGVAYRGGQATPLGNSLDTGPGAGFMRVDLQQDTSTPKMPFSDTLGRLRSSSVSSLASDSSFMFPVLESSGSTYNFQSDLESCSEASESVGPNINKEQLVVAYQKIQQKYHKYKGRYSDLARHYRDLERDNKNAKHILTECQDKALRRMTELKEQCNLEKQAKAHLEEALRSDLEEKDHLIDTLKTKIKLLRTQAEQTHNEGQPKRKSSLVMTEVNEATASAKLTGQEDLLTGGDSSSTLSSTAVVLTPEPAGNADAENAALKEKLKKLESLLHKCKEDITNKRESIKQLESDKNIANAKIEAIQQQLVAIQRREEEASLSLAKNKQTIHLELESKEDEIKKLKTQLTAANNIISERQTELLRFQEDSKKELALAKVESTKSLKAELEEVLAQNRNLEESLSSRDNECKALEKRISEAMKRLEENEAQLNPLLKAKQDLEQGTKLLHEEVSQLQDRLKTSSEKDSTIEKLRPIFDSVQKLQGLHKLLKDDVANTQSENLATLNQHNQVIQEKITTIISNLTQEHNKVLSELDVYKNESVNARESLASVNNKFLLLEQTLSTEKIGVESKISGFEEELKKAEEKIASLEDCLKSESASRKLVEEESSKKLVLLQNELGEERNKNKSVNNHFKSAEHSLNSLVDDLKGKLDSLEQEKARIMQDYINEKEKSDYALSSSEQLQQQLEMLTQRNGELINEITSLTMLQDEKSSLVAKLEGTVSELEISLDSAVREKFEMEDKWAKQESELVATVAALEKKHQEACDLVEDMKGKEVSISDESRSKITYLEKEVGDKENQIENLQKNLKCLEVDIDKASMRNLELQKELESVVERSLQQQGTNDKLMQSIDQLQSDIKTKSDTIGEMEKKCADFEINASQVLEQSDFIEKMQEKLNHSEEERGVLRVKVEETAAASSKLEELLDSKSKECVNLIEEVEKLNLAQSDFMKMLQQKSDDLLNMTERLKEYEDLKLKLDSVERKQSDDTDELAAKRETCAKLTEIVHNLEKDKIKITETLEQKSTEIDEVVSRLEVMKKEHSDQCKLVQDKTEECATLESKLTSLTSDNEKLTELLKQKTSECQDKEDQLDNLAEEMKRVEELSQELHRINDDRDANVEVLSTEASSLAQKVEELTVTTQELKEREVDLLGKLQVAQNLEAEYTSTKQREELLLSKLNEAKCFEVELKSNEEDLLLKAKKINELEEENKKLKEAGENLTQMIDRAKEAEAKCAKLQDDGVGLLLRIQKAEEAEIRCALLEEELAALKRDKAELSQEVEALHSKALHQETTADQNSLVLKEPVVEEPCVIKHYAELTETSVVEEWQQKYNKLLEQHNLAMQENADVVQRLKEENIVAASSRNLKQKERLWDRQDPVSLSDGSSNGSLNLIEKLQQQLANATNQLKETKKQHRQEVDDLRRILLNHGSSSNHVSSRSDNLEDATELEYLRNILYEYMMGKEPMILARVIAAVVKFDSDQTTKVLQKEQQRLSLLGHLGIS